MSPRARRQIPSSLANALLTIGIVLLGTVVAEGIVRHLDGLPLDAFPLPEAAGGDSVTDIQLDGIARAPGVERHWFFSEPPPLPNRQRPRKEWVRLQDEFARRPGEGTEFQAYDQFKAWNSVFAGDPCKHRFLRHAPGQLYVYDPVDGRPSPPYRFLPSATTPYGLVTNAYGWRGRPIEIERQPNVVRIAFVGASTTVDGHHLPFSHPEYVGHWLNLWAAARHPGIRFEVANAGRESIVSTDIAAIVRTEVLPLRPDLVVYYEGGNQFRLETIVEAMPSSAKHGPERRRVDNLAPDWLRQISRYSALARRIQAAAGFIGSDIDGREWPKPDYRVKWPQGLDEADPDIAFPTLPLYLNDILRDLDRIRADLGSMGGELALSSFMWLVKDGMTVDPIRNRHILDYLNIQNYPFRYRDIERMAAFQNRVFRKYAEVHGLSFVDVAKSMPFEPDLFVDAVHNTPAGVRVRAWVVLQQLIPTIERRLVDKSWPRPIQPASDKQTPPTFVPRQIFFDCKASRQ